MKNEIMEPYFCLWAIYNHNKYDVFFLLKWESWIKKRWFIVSILLYVDLKFHDLAITCVKFSFRMNIHLFFLNLSFIFPFFFFFFANEKYTSLMYVKLKQDTWITLFWKHDFHYIVPYNYNLFWVEDTMKNQPYTIYCSILCWDINKSNSHNIYHPVSTL